MIDHQKTIRELELEISKISHDINYLQGVLRSTRKKKERNNILQKIQDLELEQKEISNELLRRY